MVFCRVLRRLVLLAAVVSAKLGRIREKPSAGQEDVAPVRMTDILSVAADVDKQATVGGHREDHQEDRPTSPSDQQQPQSTTLLELKQQKTPMRKQEHTSSKAGRRSPSTALDLSLDPIPTDVGPRMDSSRR